MQKSVSKSNCCEKNKKQRQLQCHMPIQPKQCHIGRNISCIYATKSSSWYCTMDKLQIWVKSSQLWTTFISSVSSSSGNHGLVYVVLNFEKISPFIGEHFIQFEGSFRLWEDFVVYWEHFIQFEGIFRLGEDFTIYCGTFHPVWGKFWLFLLEALFAT